MCDNRDKSGTLLTGVVIGAAIGAGLTFLFGTPRGREIREKVRGQYPDFFEHIDDALENLGDKYGDVVEEVKKVEKEVSEMSGDSRETVKSSVSKLGKKVEEFGKKLESVSPKKHTFLKSGKPLRTR